jgi:pyruvate dehydrogenase E2 component (dihydrolipoamide acetyltransferase)
MGAIKEVLVPDIGDFSDVPVIEVMVKPGDRVKPEDSLIVLESDKATLDVPAPFGGAVRTLKVQVGDRVSEGTAILELEAEEAEAEEEREKVEVEPAVPAAVVPKEAASETAPVPEAAAAASAASSPSLPHASPAIRRFARELGVDLGHVPGSGPSQRVLKEDVQSFVRAALSGSALAVARVSVMLPSATHFDEADITDLEALHEEVASVAGSGTAAALSAFVLKAAVAALQRFPSLNASFAGDIVVPGSGYHLGFAVDTPNGRVVPVIADVNRKGVIDLAREIELLTARVRDNTLDPADRAQATFTIASLVDAGGSGFTPVVQAPAVAILGFTRSQPRLIERDGKVVTRRLLPLSLSYDSRTIDATSAARFTTCVAEVLSDPRRASL